MTKPRPARRISPVRRVPLTVEICEPRRLLATFVVTSAADNGNDSSPTPGSLRAEILLSNANPAPTGQTNQINFDIAGPSTIAPTTELPDVTAPVVIDGLTQPTTSVVLDGTAGSGPAAPALGLLLRASDSTVEGLTFDQFSVAGLELNGTLNDQIINNQFGTDATGETSTSSTGGSLGNGQIGLLLIGSSYNLIQGNVSSGNGQMGIQISGTVYQPESGPTDNDSLGNKVEGNEVGTDKLGTRALSNGVDGVYLNNATGNTVGGLIAADANVISGNGNDGILIDDGSNPLQQGISGNDNVIEGNKIGTDVTGTKPIGNAVGVAIERVGFSNTIGGSVAAAGNIIADNTGDGVAVNAADTYVAFNTIDSNGGDGIDVNGAGQFVPGYGYMAIDDNLIGTNAEGESGLGNRNAGISINSFFHIFVVNNIVADTLQGPGIDVENSSLTYIEGDLIGTDPSGTVALGNHGDGILLNNSAYSRINGTVSSGSVTGYGIEVKGTYTYRSPGYELDDGNPIDLALIQDHIGSTCRGPEPCPTIRAASRSSVIILMMGVS